MDERLHLAQKCSICESVMKEMGHFLEGVQGRVWDGIWETQTGVMIHMRAHWHTDLIR